MMGFTEYVLVYGPEEGKISRLAYVELSTHTTHIHIYRERER